ncbi:hypothetical protein EII34_08005 [Arachnia propionica]|uniref:Uncharacterized protein n=1 Tax=Arachnia propionica TaxID=1750 RepID=A0A3P1T676_9ACTN|nr:hypothetical protein [Arachnia propionica]MDO5083422.1 hypothetical protein [Arachnia propionica]RRD04864.1 hypothetical protein EII34_08005 [Arachnia propionica]
MLKRLLVGTATISLSATLAVGQAWADELVEPSEYPYPGEPGVTWYIGRHSDGWAPVTLNGECGPGTKRVELEFAPAGSVSLLGHEGRRTADGRLGLTLPLEVTAPWTVLTSATGQITVDVSCIVEDDVVDRHWNPRIDTATPDPDAPGVTATPVDQVFHPGGEIEIAVQGFKADDDLTVEMYSTPVRLGTARTDARGSALIRSRIPDDTTEGTHHIVVTGSDGRRALFRFRVGPKPSLRPSPRSTTPQSAGSDTPQAATVSRAGRPHPAGTHHTVRRTPTATRPGLPSTGS